LEAATVLNPVRTVWHWHEKAGVPYLTCDLLADFVHGFFTRDAQRTPAELADLLQPEAIAYRTRQVHGKRVITPSAIAASDELLAADGTLSDRPDQALWTASADCTPALLADRATGRVAAVHAGWRGTAQRILPEAIAQFLATGSQLADLRVALGPAISGPAYQVDRDCAAAVGASLFPEAAPVPDALLAALHALPEPPLLSDPQPGKVRLDVRRANALQLLQLGLQPEQMAIAPHCTYREPERFYSYRRTREKAVQWSGIVSRAPRSG